MNIIDTNKTFQLNKDMEINPILINDVVVGLEIFDFYQDPDAVKTIADNTYISMDFEDPLSYYSMFRAHIPYILPDQYFQDLSQIVFDNMNTDKYYCKDKQSFKSNSNSLMFNYMDPVIKSPREKRRPTKTVKQPHTDPNFVAFIIYLTKDDAVGTSLMREKTSKIYFEAQNELQEKWYQNKFNKKLNNEKYSLMMKQKKYYLENNINVDDGFDRLYTSSGKYNSALVFFGGLIHYANNYDNKIRKERLVQAVFLD